MRFKAFRINKDDAGVHSGFTQMSVDELTAGDVLIGVEYSTVNYKDALAATGAAPILRKYPLNGGVDLAGKVVESVHPDFKVGDTVLANGQGLSEIVDGGYAQYARLEAKNIIKMPAGMDAYCAMSIGTAGFTAAMAYMRMQQNQQSPDQGPIVVTGATGGVGSLAINLFSDKGFEVIAITGKSQQHDYLRALGASEILPREACVPTKAPLAKALWGGAIDNVGGETLAWLTQTVNTRGNIASIGLAGGVKLNTTVMPFILRGIALLGINSIEMPQAMRQSIWNRVATDLSFSKLDKVIQKEINFQQLPEVFDDFINADITGRVVVKIN